MSTSRDAVTEEAIEIGEELRSIEHAIGGASVEWSNQHFGEAGFNRADFYETPIYQHLDRYRTQLRRRLLELPAEPNEGDQE